MCIGLMQCDITHGRIQDIDLPDWSDFYWKAYGVKCPKFKNITLGNTANFFDQFDIDDETVALLSREYAKIYFLNITLDDIQFEKISNYIELKETAKSFAIDSYLLDSDELQLGAFRFVRG